MDSGIVLASVDSLYDHCDYMIDMINDFSGSPRNENSVIVYI